MDKLSYLSWILGTPVISTDELRLNDWKYPDYSVEDPFSIRKRNGPVPAVVCKDGATVSVQASEYMYCSPQNNHGNWFQVECGYPSVVPPESWRKYSEDSWDVPFIKRVTRAWGLISFTASASFNYGTEGNKYVRWIRGARRGFRRFWRRITRPQACDTIYPYIPVERVEEFIMAHGGEDTLKCFENLKEWDGK